MTDSVDRLGIGCRTYETNERTDNRATYQPSLTFGDARTRIRTEGDV